jgi:GT2 family glycosyltransferase
VGEIMKQKFTVSIVIPNWNGKDLMAKHLRRVTECAPGAEIIVSDDASTDGSVGYLKKNFPEVIIVEKDIQDGFAGNANAGVAVAHGDIVFLLNTDVEPENGFLDPLLAHFNDPKVFAVGSMDRSPEQGKTILRGRGVATWNKGFYDHQRGEVDRSDTAWVSGGSGAFRRSYWEMLGGMDPLYNPFYWEDIDISYRAQQAGCKTIFEPKSVVDHYHEEGKIRRKYTPDEVRRIAYRNQFTFIWKNAVLSQLLTHLIWAPYKIVKEITHGDRLILKGWFDAFIRFPAILAARKRNNDNIRKLRKLLSCT